MTLFGDLVCFLIVVFSAFVVGHLVFRRLLYRVLPSLAYVWLSVSFGLLLFSYIIFLLGCFHRFTVASVSFGFSALWIVVIILFLRRSPAFQELRGLWNVAQKDMAVLVRKHSILSGALGAWLLWGFLGCGAPEVRGDPIIYHITEAWLFVINRGHIEIPSSALTYIPQNQQLLYALALLLGSDSLAKLFHWLAGVLLILGTYQQARLLGARTRAALAAGLILSAVPMWLYLATTTYIDLAVGNYILAGIYLLAGDLKWRRKARGSAFIAGLFMGGALGCKYTAGLVGFLPSLSALLIVLGMQGRSLRHKIIEAASFLSVGTFLTALPWLVRNWLWTGNPVAPSFIRFLGPPNVPQSTLNWPDILAVPPEPVWPLGQLLKAYVKMFLSFGDFGNFLPYIASVLLLFAAVISRESRRLIMRREVAFLLLFLLFSFLLGVPFAALRRDSRYIMAHAAILAGLITAVYEILLRVFSSYAQTLQRCAAMVLVILNLSGAWQVYARYVDLRESMFPIFSEADRDRYRGKFLDRYYANKELGALVSPTAGKVLGASYPAAVNYVLWGAPMTADLEVQRVGSLKPEHLPGLRRQGVRFLFGDVEDELLPFVRLVGKSGGVPLWEITTSPR